MRDDRPGGQVAGPGAGDAALGGASTDRTHLIAPTLEALSRRYGGVVVALLTVDDAVRAVTPVAVHDPDARGHEELVGRLGTAIPLAGTVCGLVCEGGGPVAFGDGGNPAVGDEMLPEGWLRYADRTGVRGGVVLPVTDGGLVVAMVVVARRTPEPFEGDELVALEESAQRLGQLLPPHPRRATEPDPADPVHRRSRWHGVVVDLAIGLAVPLVLAVALDRVEDPNRFRPGAALVLAATTVGLVRNRLAAAVCSVAGLGVVAWLGARTAVTSDDRAALVGGTAVVALTLLGVQVLLDRVVRARRRQAREAATVDALVGRLSIGFGLLDGQKRFVRANEALAVLDGTSAQEHVGRRPGDVNPLTGELYEHLVDEVLRGGDPVLGRVVSFEVPETGLVHSWRVDLYPLQLDDRMVGAGLTVADVTEETIGRRRAQLLLQLARTAAGAPTAELVADEVARVLADGLKARCTVLVRSGERVEAMAVRGHHDLTAAERWSAFDVTRSRRGPAAACLAASELVIAQVAPTIGPDVDAEEQVHRALGDLTVVWQPVTRPGDDQAFAAIGLAWPYARQLTEHSRTMLQTAASITGLALARIALTERTERDRFRTAMDAMIDQVVLARSVRDEHGELVDFEIEFANAAALVATGRTAGTAIGLRVSDLYPRWRASGMFDRYRAVVETGEPWVAERLHYADRTPDGREVRGFWNLQVVKVDDGYIAASRDVTELVAAERLAEQAREVAQRERIAVDLLQRTALPEKLPEVAGVRLAAHYQPARRQQPVGGDWYDAFRLGDDQLALVIADVAGDGPEAASTMLQVRNIVRAVAAEHEDPGTVLARVDEVLLRVSERDAPFATCTYATLGVRTGCLRWASAGHLPLVAARADGTVELLDQVPGPPLGSLGGGSFPVSSTLLGPGDLVVLYTDGLVERRGEVIDVGLQRLVRQLRQRPSDACDDVVAHLAAALEDPSDDTAVLCAAMAPPRRTDGHREAVARSEAAQHPPQDAAGRDLRSHVRAQGGAGHQPARRVDAERLLAEPPDRQHAGHRFAPRRPRADRAT